MADKRNPPLPPSLNRIRSAPAPNETEEERQHRDHANARLRRNEREKNQKKARERNVERAMRSLRLTTAANSQVSGFVFAFEMTFYEVERKKNDAPATAATIEKQFTDIARKSNNLIKHLQKIHRDVNQALWPPLAIWQLSQFLDELQASAERSLVAFKAGRRAAKKGNPGDVMAAKMTDCAALVYVKLTGKPINQGTKSGSFEVFLEGIFKAYEIGANRQHCIRQLQTKRFGGN
jgi:hypothetical protein